MELVPCEGSTSTTSGSSRDVRVGFRLDDGHRTQWTGPVNSSIWDILEHIATTDERQVKSHFAYFPHSLF